ncbi:MAG: phage portal protein, partial [Methanosarcinales archaeon]|nr:phage portal protein [Methanosarcinales archaeon]
GSYADALKLILGPKFNRTLRNVGADALNCAIGWLYVWIDDNKELRFRKINPTEAIPIWSDDEETELECFIRVYGVDVIDPTNAVNKTETRVEVFLPDGITFYIYDGGALILQTRGAYLDQIDADGIVIKEFDWGRIPIIGFRYNPSKIPLIRRIKTLQDALNEITSFFMNNMQEDARSTIFVLTNYGGQDGAEFKNWLMRTGVVNVTSYDGAKGGVETLQVEVNAENYELLISTLKKAIVENGRGYDAKEANSGGDPNEMNLKSMYVDIDLDTNMMETEFQAGFEELFYFIDSFLEFSGSGDFSKTSVEVIFNRDTIVDESSIVDMISKLAGIVSNQTLREQVPFIRDPVKEEERIRSEAADQHQNDEMYAASMALKEPPEDNGEE